LQRAVARVKAKERREFLAAMAYMDEIHKSAVPGAHWYLWALAVEPGCQGQGIGSRLLRPVLARADKEGLSCYLETHAERNVAFYQKWGFRVVNDDLMPGQGGRMWTMLRETNR
jgi:ribosomal protein S18 acetylase RimI-like enzyme